MLYQDTLRTSTGFTRIPYIRLQALPGYITYVYRLYQDTLHTRTSTGFTRILYIRLQALPGYLKYVYRLYQDTSHNLQALPRLSRYLPWIYSFTRIPSTHLLAFPVYLPYICILHQETSITYDGFTRIHCLKSHFSQLAVSKCSVIYH